jgi:hypothetical protein
MNLYYPLGIGLALIKHLQNKITVLGKRDGFGILVIIADPLVKEIRQLCPEISFSVALRFAEVTTFLISHYSLHLKFAPITYKISCTDSSLSRWVSIKVAM